MPTTNNVFVVTVQPGRSPPRSQIYPGAGWRGTSWRLAEVLGQNPAPHAKFVRIPGRPCAVGVGFVEPVAIVERPQVSTGTAWSALQREGCCADPIPAIRLRGMHRGREIELRIEFVRGPVGNCFKVFLGRLPDGLVGRDVEFVTEDDLQFVLIIVRRSRWITTVGDDRDEDQGECFVHVLRHVLSLTL